ncbi:MAG: MipA/OmpV family protein [Wenzhouxiangellaceae bacterium]
MPKRVRGLLVLLGLALAPLPGWGQEEEGLFAGLLSLGDLLLPDRTQLTVGAGPRFGPDYLGSDDYEVAPDLALFVRFGDKFILESDGASLDILGLSDIQFGPVVRYSGGRNDNANEALTGLGDISGSLDFGAFVKARVANRFTARLRYSHALIGGDNGGLLDLQFNTLLYNVEPLAVVLSLRGSVAEPRRARRFFGISEEQSLESGLPEFDPGTSLQDIRLTLGARWQFTPKWSVNAFTRYTRLTGDIVDSPIIKPLGSRNQFTIGAVLAYTFEFEFD